MINLAKRSERKKTRIFKRLYVVKGIKQPLDTNQNTNGMNILVAFI